MVLRRLTVTGRVAPLLAFILLLVLVMLAVVLLNLLNLTLPPSLVIGSRL
jgi:hypothetical protein